MSVQQEGCYGCVSTVCRQVQCRASIHHWQLAVLPAGIQHGLVDAGTRCQQRMNTPCSTKH